MEMQRTIVHASRHFPAVEFRGRTGADAAEKIKEAISRGKELDIRETHVPVEGSLKRHDLGWRIMERELSGNLTLGADMIYEKTTTVALAWGVLGSILRTGKMDFEFVGRPLYVSSAGQPAFNAASFVFGRSSLLAALGEPAPDKGHQESMRSLLECIGAIVRMREIIIAIPTLSGEEGKKGVCSLDDMPGVYAMEGEVPLEGIFIVNSLGPEELGELCAAEARVEMFRTEGKSVADLEKEMLGRIKNMEPMVEPGREMVRL